MKKFITRAVALLLVLGMVFNTNGVEALAGTFGGTIGTSSVKKQKADYDAEMLSMVTDIVQDEETAEKVLDALYEKGLVDETGIPIAKEYLVVDGKVMSMDDLKAEANTHTKDELETVSIDGYEVTWAYVKALFAIKEMQDTLTDAKKNGYYIDAEAVYDFANQLDAGLVEIDDYTEGVLGGGMLGEAAPPATGLTRIYLHKIATNQYQIDSASMDEATLTKVKASANFEAFPDLIYPISDEKVKQSDDNYYIDLELMDTVTKETANRVSVYVEFNGVSAAGSIYVTKNEGVAFGNSKPEFHLVAVRDSAEDECSVDICIEGGDLEKGKKALFTYNDENWTNGEEGRTTPSDTITLKFEKGQKVVQLGTEDSIYNQFKTNLHDLVIAEKRSSGANYVAFMTFSNCKNCVVGLETDGSNPTKSGKIDSYGTFEALPLFCVFYPVTGEEDQWAEKAEENTITPELEGIKDGIYFYGDRVPFRVKLNNAIDLTREENGGDAYGITAELDLQGEKLYPGNFSNPAEKFEFWFDYVCNRELDAATLNASAFNLKAIAGSETVAPTVNSFHFKDGHEDWNSEKDKYDIYPDTPVTKFEYAVGDMVNAGACANIRLSTPDKIRSFEPDKATYVNKDGELYLRIPVKDCDKTLTEDMLPYINWICADTATDSENRVYLKSMLAAGTVKDDEGNTISYLNPVYLELSNETFEYTDPTTGQKVQASERPMAIYTKAELDGSDDGSFALGVQKVKDSSMLSTIEFVGRRAIGGTDDITAVLATQTPETLHSKLESGEWVRFSTIAGIYDPLPAEKFWEYAVDSSNFKDWDLSRNYSYSKNWIFPCLDIAKVYAKEDDVKIVYNDTWKYYQGSEEDATIYKLVPDKYDKYIDGGKAPLTLSYEITSLVDLDKTAPADFSWSSSDETIATVTTEDVSGIRTAKIQILGKTGTVKFTLKNRDEVVWESASITVSEAASPFLYVPSTSQPVIALKGYSSDVVFCSNIPAFNDAVASGSITGYALNVYKAVADSSSGTTVYNKGTSVLSQPVTATATAENPVNILTIPTQVLTDVSESGSVSYIAEITAVYKGSEYDIDKDSTTFVKNEDGTFTFSTEVYVKVKNAPVKAQFTDVKNYCLDNTANTISWEVLGDCNADAKWSLVVTDENGFPCVNNAGTGTIGMPTSYTVSKDVISGNPEIKDNTLKKIYTVSFSISNNPEEEGYSVASTMLYVYNAKALDILVNEAHHSTHVDGDKVTFDNTAYVSSKADDKGVLDIDLAELQRDITLKAAVSINFGDYVWGLVSDQLKWKVTDTTEGVEAANLYYAQDGRYGNVDFNLLPSFMPINSFMLVGEKEGSGKLICTHAKSGLETSVDIDVHMLTGEFFLFQFYPLAETEFTYTNGAGETVTVKSKANGQLALYEPDGIKPGSYVYYSSVVDDICYAGVSSSDILKSGENNNVLGGLYPVNNFELTKTEEVSIFLKKPDGKPLANTDVTIHGGIYFNSNVATDKVTTQDACKEKIDGYVYQPQMDLLTPGQAASAETNHEGNEETSNGLTALTFTTDDKGMIRVVANMEQLGAKNQIVKTNGNKLSAGQDLMFVLQLEFADDTYQPVVIQRKLMGTDGKYLEAPVFTLKTAKPQLISLNGERTLQDKAPFIAKIEEFKITDNGTFPITIGSEVNCLGADKDNPNRSAKVTTYGWGLDELTGSSTDTPTEKKDVYDSYSILFADILKTVDISKPITAGGGLLEHNNTLAKNKSRQKVNKIYYPFSTFVIYETTMDFNESSYFVEGEVGEMWLEYQKSLPTDIALVENWKTGDQKVLFRTAFPYKIANNLNVPKIAENGGTLSADVKAYLENMQKNEEFKLGDVIPGGDIISSVMAIVSGFKSGGDHQLNLTIAPTADPNIYKVLVTMGDESGVLTASQANSGEEIEDGIHSHFGDDHVDGDKLGQLMDKVLGNETIGKSDDDDNKFQAKYGGAFIGNAELDKEGKWHFSITGGYISLGFEYEVVEETQNILVGPLPVTYTISAKASVMRTYSVDKVYIPKYIDNVTGEITDSETDIYEYENEPAEPETTYGFMSDSVLGVEVKAFAGIGFDASVVAFKFGIAGSVAANLYYALGVVGSTPMAGVGVSLQGGIAIQFTASLLFIEYTKTFASASFDVGVSTSSYAELTSLFNSPTAMDEKYAGGYAGGTATFMDRKASKNTAEDDERIITMAKGASIFKQMEEEKENYGTVSLSDDGEVIFYADNFTASYADKSGNNKGNIVEINRDSTSAALDEKGDYGHFYLDGAGSGDDLYATWVVQTQKSSNETMAAGDSLADLAVALNSTEVVAAVYDETTEKWDATQLSDNNAPDMSPSISSYGDRAIVVWRSLYGSDSSNPLNFNVDDNIVYKVYNGTAWSETSSIIYNGSAGKVQALDSCMLEDGTAVVAFTVQTDDEGKDEGLETYYSIISPDGTLKTANASNDAEHADVNAKVISVGDEAVIAWFTNQNADGTEGSDIRLLGVEADGTLDTAIPQSVGAIDSSVEVARDFEISGNSKESLVVAWSVQRLDESKSELKDGVSNIVYASKISKGVVESAPDLYTMTTPSPVIRTQGKAIDSFKMHASGNNIDMYLSETVYGETKTIGTLMVDEVVIRANYSSDEDYDAAVASFNAKYPSGCPVLETPGYFKFEKKAIELVNELSLMDVQYNQDGIIPGTTINVSYTLMNTGVGVIDKIKIDGEEYVINLAPNKQTTVNVGVSVPATVTDHTFTITKAEGGVEFEGSTGTLKFNIPKVTISSANVEQAGKGVRNINVNLYNDGFVPMEGSGRKLELSLYTDSTLKTKVGDSVQITDNDEQELIDLDAETVTIPLSISDYVTKYNKALEDEARETLDLDDEAPIPEDVKKRMLNVGTKSEIPSDGLSLYLVSNVKNDDDEILYASATPLTLASALNDAETPAGVTCTEPVITPVSEGSTTGAGIVAGSGTVYNDSIIARGNKHYLINVIDKEDKVIAQKLVSFDVEAESSYDFNYEFSLPAIEDIKGVTIEETEEAKLGVPESEDYLFKGWYTDATLTTPVSGSEATVGYAKWVAAVMLKFVVNGQTTSYDYDLWCEGGKVIDNVTAPEGYEFVDWEYNGSKYDLSHLSDLFNALEATTKVVGQPMVVTAEFVQVFDVEVYINGAKDDMQSGKKRKDTKLTLTAAASLDPDLVFAGWTDEAGTVLCDEASYEVTVTADIKVYAKYLDAAALALANAKKEAAQAIDTKVSTGDSDKVEAIAAEAKEAIEACTSEGDVTTTLAEYIGKIDFRQQQDAACTSIDELTKSNASNEVKALAAEAKAAIEECEDATELTSALQEHIKKISDQQKKEADEAARKAAEEAARRAAEEAARRAAEEAARKAAAEEAARQAADEAAKKAAEEAARKAAEEAAKAQESAEDVEVEVNEVMFRSSDKKMVKQALAAVKALAEAEGVPSGIKKITPKKSYKLEILDSSEEGELKEVRIAIPEKLVNDDPDKIRLYYLVTKDADEDLKVISTKFNEEDSSIYFDIDASGKYVLAYADVPYFAEVGTVLDTAETGNGIYRVVKAGNKDGKVGVAEYIGSKKAQKDITVKAKIKVDGITYKVKSVAHSALAKSTVETVTFGKYVETLSSKDFKGCVKLKEIKVHESLYKKAKKIVKKLGLQAVVINLDDKKKK